jgi:hypothetical protein
MATMLIVLAAVPAVFQYGLWDATTQDRCRRLELLLLSEINGYDYAHAALSAAWARGRGYLAAALLLWLSLLISGRCDLLQFLATLAGAAILWALCFAVGFRSFARGQQTNGIASLMTLGIPMIVVMCHRLGYPEFAASLPHGWCDSPMRTGLSWPWFVSVSLGLLLTIWLIRSQMRDCVRDLQSWYDQNHGQITSAG